MRKLVLALPKGSLQESTFELLGKAGWKVRVGSRSYYPYVDDEELTCILLRPQEMPRYVQTGALDAGIDANFATPYGTPALLVTLV